MATLQTPRTKFNPFRRIRRALTFANVCSFLALTIALGTGTAYAANTVFSTDIVDGEVMNADLASNAVSSAKIANQAVKTTDLGDAAVTAAKIGDGEVTSSKIAAGAVDTLSILNGTISSTDIAASTITGSNILNGSVLGSDLATDTISSGNIGSSAVGSSEIADNSVASADILNESVLSRELKGGYSNGAVSFGAGAVANGRCSQFGVSVPGAAVGDTVLMSVDGAVPSGALFNAIRVASAENVTINYCNFSGGTIPAITSLPVRIVTFAN